MILISGTIKHNSVVGCVCVHCNRCNSPTMPFCCKGANSINTYTTGVTYLKGEHKDE